MIPIRFKNEKQVFSVLYNKILSSCNKYAGIDTWCRKNLCINSKRYSFEKIIKARYDELEFIKKFLDNNKKINDDFKDKYGEYMAKTVYFKCLDRETFFEALNISVCPYCNRNYIKLPGGKHSFQLDHFFNKDDYPIFAISFNNLVPSCYSCNHKKEKERFTYSPHNPTYRSADEIGYFEYWVTAADYMTNKDSIEVQYNPEKIMTGNDDVLNISGIYSLHKNEVLKILKKSYIVSDDYIKDLYKNYKTLFSSSAEVGALLFDVVTKDTQYSNESLSKFKSDIYKQVRDEFYNGIY